MAKKSGAIKRDKYKSSRGGNSRLLDIYCYTCQTLVLKYQKDGPGNLLRLYLDRIHWPPDLTGLQKLNLKDVLSLKCSGCQAPIGNPYIYEKEKRLAFRLIPHSFIKEAG